jgi:hypothetical protein
MSKKILEIKQNSVERQEESLNNVNQAMISLNKVCPSSSKSQPDLDIVNK